MNDNGGRSPGEPRRPRRPQIRVQAFLANLPIFSELSAEELDRVAQGTIPVYAERGETIVRNGDPCTGFHVVVYGQVKIGFTSLQGVEKVLDIIRPGQSFGEALMFLEKAYIVSAQAIADSMLLHVSKQTVFEQLDHHAGFARRMLAGLALRLHGLVRDVEAYTLRSGAERVIGYLLRDVPDAAAASGGPIEVQLPAGKSIIASRLNMTPEHFSRILHDLSSSGLIAVEGRKVRILDLSRLPGGGG